MESLKANEELLHKWDVILVEIFKKEWPNSWTSFVKDLVNAAMESESSCQNSMYILKIVVEDVFQFNNTMTSDFSEKIRESLQSDMVDIFNVPLLLASPAALHASAGEHGGGAAAPGHPGHHPPNSPLLPEDCVFNYQLIDVLLKFLSLDAFRTSAMRCLQEILTHPASARYPRWSCSRCAASWTFWQVLRRCVTQQGFLDPASDLASLYPQLSSPQLDFLHTLALFLTGVAQQHAQLLQASGRCTCVSPPTCSVSRVRPTASC